MTVAEIHINKTYIQYCPSGILIAQAIGKLSFCPLTSLRADKKHLPFKEGRDAPSEVGHPFS
jgi:hypothetical protein